LLSTAAHYWQVDTSVMPARRRRRRRRRSSRSFSGTCEECRPRIASTSKNQVFNSIYAQNQNWNWNLSNLFFRIGIRGFS
jgi:hypothetical protein